MVMSQSKPSNRKPLSPIIPSDRSFSPDRIPSPTSPLERNSLTPRGWKQRESDGIGLAIVASLERSTPARHVASSQARHVSSPISIKGYFEVSDLACSGRCGSSVCGNGNGKLGNGEFKVADFLSYCGLCRKRLHGKDIYMYRGEKAFCSMECRYQQIVNDEYQEKCGNEMSKNAEIVGSPYTSDRIFFTGIVTA